VRPETLLVSASDKLHNARAIVHDVRHEGNKVWERFNPAPPEVLWYYTSLLQAYKERHAPFKPLLRELERVIAQLEKLVRAVERGGQAALKR
jgi:GTP pyrophosphokinase